MMALFVETCTHIFLMMAPWLLLGALVAGTIHVFVPKQFIERQFSGYAGVLKAVSFGVPLPLCSCGVIPAGLGLKKNGASDGASVGFLISTPQTGVDSLLVSASFLGWPFAAFKVGAAFLTGLVGGWLTEAFSTEVRGASTAPEHQATATRPKVRDGVDHAIMLLQTIWRWVVFGILASAAIELWVPKNWFAELANYPSAVPVVLVLAIAVPLYVCATASVPIAAALVAAGLTPGAALVFLMAGPATNMATIGAIYKTLGFRAFAAYLGTIVVGSVLLGSLFDAVIDPRLAERVTHTHESFGPFTMATGIVLAALMLGFGFKEARSFLARLKPAGRHDLAFALEGLTCDGCARKLSRALLAAPQVAAASVSVDRATVSGTASPEDIARIAAELGYSATLITEP